jgi:type III restriction enzyme
MMRKRRITINISQYVRRQKNRIRAIFAVQKLNEGWDVLNLFDIVRAMKPEIQEKAKLAKLQYRKLN